MFKRNLLIFLLLILICQGIAGYFVFWLQNHPIFVVNEEGLRGDAASWNRSILSWQLCSNVWVLIGKEHINTVLSAKEVAQLLKKNWPHVSKSLADEDEARFTDDDQIIDKFGTTYTVTFDGKTIETRASGSTEVVGQALDSNEPVFER